jgi:hypothetical protein
VSDHIPTTVNQMDEFLIEEDERLSEQASADGKKRRNAILNIDNTIRLTPRTALWVLTRVSGDFVVPEGAVYRKAFGAVAMDNPFDGPISFSSAAGRASYATGLWESMGVITTERKPGTIFITRMKLTKLGEQWIRDTAFMTPDQKSVLLRTLSEARKRGDSVESLVPWAEMANVRKRSSKRASEARAKLRVPKADVVVPSVPTSVHLPPQRKHAIGPVVEPEPVDPTPEPVEVTPPAQVGVTAKIHVWDEEGKIIVLERDGKVVVLKLEQVISS